MDPYGLIAKHYNPYPKALELLLAHSRAVSEMALDIATRVKGMRPDLLFVEEAALLHDIGILHTNAPSLGCFGSEPYIRHGVLGRRMLKNEGLHRHALVCERHVGIGISAVDVRGNSLPLPERDMVPISMEERIVCFADKFFSKEEGPVRAKPVEEVRRQVARYGPDKLRIFDEWLELFSI